jgi:hypothetical protein
LKNNKTGIRINLKERYQWVYTEQDGPAMYWETSRRDERAWKKLKIRKLGGAGVTVGAYFLCINLHNISDKRNNG